MRPVLIGVLAGGAAGLAGLAAGWLLFSPGRNEARPAATSSQARTQASRPAPSESAPLRGWRDATAGGEPEPAPVIDAERNRLNLPLDYWDKLAVTSFEAHAQSPWENEGEAFVVSPEMRELCELDERQCETIRRIFLDARETHMAPQWKAPTAVRQQGDAVVFEIAPAPATLEPTIRAALVAELGAERAQRFLDKVGDTLGWEFGGFGRLRRVVEVSVLPDNTLSLRESLRRTRESTPPNLTPEQARVYQQFDTRARQYRVDHLPPSIAGLVEIHDSNN